MKLPTIAFFLLLALPTVSLAYDGAWYKLNVLSVQQASGFTWVTKSFNDLEEDKYTRLNIAVTNVGTAQGLMKVEGGVYQRRLINSWYNNPVLALVSPINNCVPSETNVDTVNVALNAGETTVVELTVITPKVSGDNADYGFHIQTFANCASTGLAIGQTDIKVLPATIKECGILCLPKASPSCSDSEVNGLETDLNCGGGECAPCPKNNICKTEVDCQSGLNCITGFGGRNRCNVQTASPPVTVPVSPDVSATCGNGRTDIAETCSNCPKDVTGCPISGSSGYSFGTIALVLGGIVLLYLGAKKYL